MAATRPPQLQPSLRAEGIARRSPAAAHLRGKSPLEDKNYVYILTNCRNPACASLRRRGNRVTHIARTSALPDWGRAGQPHGPDRRATGDYRNYPTIKEMS